MAHEQTQDNVYQSNENYDAKDSAYITEINYLIPRADSKNNQASQGNKVAISMTQETIESPIEQQRKASFFKSLISIFALTLFFMLIVAIAAFGIFYLRKYLRSTTN